MGANVKEESRDNTNNNLVVEHSDYSICGKPQTGGNPHIYHLARRFNPLPNAEIHDDPSQ